MHCGDYYWDKITYDSDHDHNNNQSYTNEK